MTTKKSTKKEIEIPAEFTKLVLKGAKVIFANLEDEGYGTSLTIDATDPDIKDLISAWVEKNKIGKDNPGVANFKEYTPEDSDEVTLQYSFKINDHTKFKGMESLTKEDLGFGAVVDLVANPFIYDNKFGKGVSQSLSAVLIRTGTTSSADGDMDELTADIEDFG